MQNEVPPAVMLMMSLRISVCMHMSAPVCNCVHANLCCHYCCAVIMILAWHMVFLLCNIMISTRILKLQEHCVRRSDSSNPFTFSGISDNSKYQQEETV